MTLHRRLRGEDGQSTVEWLGVAFVVTALILALTALASPMGDRVGEAFTCLVSRVTGDGAACGSTASSRPGEPDFACVTSSTTGSVNGSVRVAVVDLGGGQAYIREEMSDGTIRVTFIDNAQLGVSLAAGGGLSADVNGTGGGGAAAASVGVAITGGTGQTVVFDDADDADQYIQDTITDEVIDALPPVVSVPASGVRWIIDQITGHQTPQGQDGGSQVSVGIAGEADATGAAGPVRLDGEALAQAGATVVRNPDGSTDVTIAAGVAADGTASVVGGVTGSLGTAGSVTISLDADGNPVAVTVSGQVDGSVGAGLVGLDQIEGLDESLGALLVETGGRGTVTATLDLTDPALDGDVDVVVDQLRGAADGHGLDGVVDAVGDLMGGMAEAVTVTVTTHSMDTAGTGVEGSVSAVVGLGGEIEVDMVTLELDSAHYWDPALGAFVPWTSCTR